MKDVITGAMEGAKEGVEIGKKLLNVFFGRRRENKGKRVGGAVGAFCGFLRGLFG